MKKIFLTVILLNFWVITLAQAQNVSTTLTPQNIRLKDGTVIKGNLIGVSGNTYLINSTNLGKLEVKISSVESISAADAPAAAQTPNPLSAGTPTAMPQALPPQMQQIQQQMLADPQIVAAIQELAADPEIAKLIQNPGVMQAALSRDPALVQGNAEVQQLLQNPKMKRVMDMMSQKLQQQPAGSPQPSQ